MNHIRVDFSSTLNREPVVSRKTLTIRFNICQYIYGRNQGLLQITNDLKLVLLGSLPYFIYTLLNTRIELTAFAMQKYNPAQ